MKVLIPHNDNLTKQSIKIGYYNALKHSGFDAKVYHDDNQTFDMFTDNPDIFLCFTSDLTRAITKNLLRKHVIPLIIMDTAQPEQNFMLNNILKKNLHIKFLITPYLPKYYSIAYQDIRFPILTIHPAGDIIRYKPSKSDPVVQSELTYIGTYTIGKSEIIQKYLVPLLNNYNIKIFGYNKWPLAQHIGSISSNEFFSTIVASAKYTLVLTNDTPMYVSEKSYKVMACGGLLLHKYTEYFPKGTYQNFMDPVDMQAALQFRHNDEYLEDIKQKGRRFILSSNTYFHRLLSIFKRLGVAQPKLEEKINEIGSSS
jgi:hypothetical protein